MRGEGKAFFILNVNVRFRLTLAHIVDYDAASEEVIIHAFLKQTWVNPSLSWDPDEYGGIKRINVSPEKTWIPDIHAYWNSEASQFKYNGMLNTLKTTLGLHRSSCTLGVE